MKHLKSKAASISTALALLLGASAGSAQSATPANPNQLIGSDTLQIVMNQVIAGLTGVPGGLSGVGILTYNGLGSTTGERQLEGSPSSTEPSCTPNDPDGAPDGNPGCEEISPMSRQMDSSICDDTESAGAAEGLAICADGLVVITNNNAAQQFAVNAASCVTETTDNSAGFPDRAYGNLRDSGSFPVAGQPDYVIGGGVAPVAGPANAWKDVLRITYTGCQNTDGNCLATDRVERCSNPVRQALVNSWGNLFEGVSCAVPGACTQLRQAYRRDDNSGTTGVFLELLGVTVSTAATPPAGQRTLNNRARIVAVGGALAPIANHAFCDGGQLEAFFPDATGTRGDPIRRTCAAEDDLCGFDRTVGIVRAIRSPVGTTAQAFPTTQCTRGSFARVNFLAVAQPVCPDGTVPLAGRCRMPFFASGGTRDFNCLNDINSRPPQLPASTDGRSYNYVMRDSAGVVQFVTAGVMPQVAQWRQNQAVLDTVVPVPGGPLPGTVCNLEDATRQIGCLVANTTCTVGFAGREAATIAPFDDLQEPVRLRDTGPSDANINANTYPFARELFVNAIGGFENITAQCNARLAPGTPPEVCADQVRIAQEFFDMTPLAQSACTNAGFIPLAASRCVGTQASAGCGAPTVQAKAACQPL